MKEELLRIKKQLSRGILTESEALNKAIGTVIQATGGGQELEDIIHDVTIEPITKSEIDAFNEIIAKYASA
jgi:hypothetical protein